MLSMMYQYKLAVPKEGEALVFQIKLYTSFAAVCLSTSVKGGDGSIWYRWSRINTSTSACVCSF
jgi:hypothetical protein